MKKKLIKFLTFILAVCLGSSIFTACNPSGDSNTLTVSKISANILDGKVANFLGAEGFGIIDKSTVVAPSSIKNFAKVYAEESTGEQKKTEFVKETTNGYVDIHFHTDNGLHKGYKNLNKK